MHAALSNVLQAFGKALFHESFRGKNQTVVFQINLKIISGSEPQLIVNDFWNNHLPANTDFDGDSRPAPLELCFHIFVLYSAMLAVSTIGRGTFREKSSHKCFVSGHGFLP